MSFGRSADSIFPTVAYLYIQAQLLARAGLSNLAGNRTKTVPPCSCSYGCAPVALHPVDIRESLHDDQE